MVKGRDCKSLMRGFDSHPGLSMKTDIKQIKESLNEKLDFLQSAYHVRGIGVFGSVARGDNTEERDIDILVEFSEPIGFFKFIELEEFLSTTLGKKVDLVTKEALKKTIKEDILSETVYV